MDAVTLYYKVLPWFWKIEWIPCFHQYPCASKYFGWSFLFAEIWRISYTGWFQCCEWDNTHPCILSCCHGLVTDAICSKIKRVAVDFVWGSSTRAPRAAVTAAQWSVILVGRRRGLRVATAAWHADGLVAWRQLAHWMPVLPAPPRRRQSSALPAKEYQLRTKQGPPRAIREEMGNRACLRSCAMSPSLLPVHEGRRSAAPNCVHGPAHCCLAFY